VKKTSARQFESPARVDDHFPGRLLARNFFDGLHRSGIVNTARTSASLMCSVIVSLSAI